MEVTSLSQVFIVGVGRVEKVEEKPSIRGEKGWRIPSGLPTEVLTEVRESGPWHMKETNDRRMEIG